MPTPRDVPAGSSSARVVHNPVTGVSLRILRSSRETGGELLEMEATYPPGSKPPPAHFHPRQEERFVVLEGTMKAKVDGKLRELRTGDELVVPAGAIHSMWNPGAAPARTSWQTRPALRTLEFFEDVCALAEQGRVGPFGKPRLLDLAILVPRYWGEIRVTKPSPLVQRLLFLVLAPFALLLGRGRRPFERESAEDQ